MQWNRRDFVQAMLGAPLAVTVSLTQARRITAAESKATGVSISEVKDGEDLFAYIRRIKGTFDPTLYR